MKKLDEICGIYKIENKIDGKIYIGQSIHVKRRWKAHSKLLNNNKHYNAHLQRAWNKYGEKNFDFFVVEIVDEHDLNACEEKWMGFYKSYDREFGYNLDIRAVGHKFSQESKDNLSRSRVGKYVGSNGGNSKYPKEDILNVIYELENSDIPISDIANKYNIKYNCVYSIYVKKIWKHLTKDIIFMKRLTRGEKSWNARITEKEAIRIINDLKFGISNAELALKYEIPKYIISDIRNKKSWVYLTNDIVFPEADTYLRGSKNSNSKLCEENVVEIKHMIKNGISSSEIAKKFNVTQQAICSIKRNENWKHIQI